jgi:hypothetical protein
MKTTKLIAAAALAAAMTTTAPVYGQSNTPEYDNLDDLCKGATDLPRDLIQRSCDFARQRDLARPMMARSMYQASETPGLPRRQDYFECSYTARICEKGWVFGRTGPDTIRLFDVIDDTDRTTVVGTGACRIFPRVDRANGWICWNFTKGTWIAEINGRQRSGPMGQDADGAPKPSYETVLKGVL